MKDFTCEINGHTLEYFDDEHVYVVDGLIVPSITQMLKVRFGKKYEAVDKEVLKRAADAGTQVHDAIEHLIRTGEVREFPEVRNFLFLQRQYGFEVKECETPVILFMDGNPVSAGRCDMVIETDGRIGGADIKRTSTLDRQYLAYQLNLYRTAYRQCYGIEWTFLRGIHLHGNTRKYVRIPIQEDVALDLVREYKERRNHE